MTPAPTVNATRPVHVAAAIALGGLVVGGALWWWQGQGGSLPVVGPVAWASVLLIAGGVAWLAHRTRRTVRTARADLPAEQALTRVVLGKTSVLGGAFLGAAYAALVVLAMPALPAPLARERVLHGSLAVIACVLWAAVGAWLQAACRIPPGDDTPDTPGVGHGGGDA